MQLAVLSGNVWALRLEDITYNWTQFWSKQEPSALNAKLTADDYSSQVNENVHKASLKRNQKVYSYMWIPVWRGWDSSKGNHGASETAGSILEELTCLLREHKENTIFKTRRV